MEGTLNEKGAKCISLVIAEVETDEEEIGWFVFRRRGGGGTTDASSTLCLLLSCGQSKVIPVGLGSGDSSAKCRGARMLL